MLNLFTILLLFYFEEYVNVYIVVWAHNNVSLYMYVHSEDVFEDLVYINDYNNVSQCRY